MEDAEWNNARYFLYSFTIVNEGQKSEETDSLLYYGIVTIKQITSETNNHQMYLVHSLVHW